MKLRLSTFTFTHSSAPSSSATTSSLSSSASSSAHSSPPVPYAQRVRATRERLLGPQDDLPGDHHFRRPLEGKLLGHHYFPSRFLLQDFSVALYYQMQALRFQARPWHPCVSQLQTVLSLAYHNLHKLDAVFHQVTNNDTMLKHPTLVDLYSLYRSLKLIPGSGLSFDLDPRLWTDPHFHWLRDMNFTNALSSIEMDMVLKQETTGQEGRASMFEEFMANLSSKAASRIPDEVQRTVVDCLASRGLLASPTTLQYNSYPNVAVDIHPEKYPEAISVSWRTFEPRHWAPTFAHPSAPPPFDSDPVSAEVLARDAEAPSIAVGAKPAHPPSPGLPRHNPSEADGTTDVVGDAAATGTDVGTGIEVKTSDSNASSDSGGTNSSDKEAAGGATHTNMRTAGVTDTRLAVMRALHELHRRLYDNSNTNGMMTSNKAGKLNRNGSDKNILIKYKQLEIILQWLNDNELERESQQFNKEIPPPTEIFPTLAHQQPGADDGAGGRAGTSGQSVALTRVLRELDVLCAECPDDVWRRFARRARQPSVVEVRAGLPGDRAQEATAVTQRQIRETHKEKLDGILNSSQTLAQYYYRRHRFVEPLFSRRRLSFVQRLSAGLIRNAKKRKLKNYYVDHPDNKTTWPDNKGITNVKWPNPNS